MDLVKWNPWREFEDLFDRYSKAVGWSRSSGQENVAAVDWTPCVDVVESEDAYELHVELPGVQRKDVQVTVDQGLLIVQGARQREEEQQGRTWHRVERTSGAFRRSFALPDDVEAQSVRASFKDGVLTVSLRKSETKRPRAIEVKVD